MRGSIDRNVSNLLAFLPAGRRPECVAVREEGTGKRASRHQTWQTDRWLRLCSHDELPQYVPADICQLAVSALVQVGQPHGRIAVLRLDFP